MYIFDIVVCIYNIKDEHDNNQKEIYLIGMLISLVYVIPFLRQEIEYELFTKKLIILKEY